MPVIKKIIARQIFDSRGNPTVEVDVITKNEIVAVPYFVAESQTFTDKLSIELGSAVGGNIYYSINDDKEKIYETPIIITADANISCHIKKTKLSDSFFWR